MLTALVIDPSPANGPARLGHSGSTDIPQAIVAETLGGRSHLAGLRYAAEAAAGRLAARRRDLAG